MRSLKFVLFSVVCLAGVAIGAEQAPYNSATISGLGARNIGSAAMSGRVSAIAATRESSGKTTIFVGAASGGVWKSEDGGTRYKPVFDEQSVQSIGAIAIDPKNSQNVWVGSGEAWTRNSVSVGDGIYKSTDSGETWSRAGLPNSERVAQIIVNSLRCRARGALERFARSRPLQDDRRRQDLEPHTKRREQFHRRLDYRARSNRSEQDVRRPLGFSSQGLGVPLRRQWS